MAEFLEAQFAKIAKPNEPKANQPKPTKQGKGPQPNIDKPPEKKHKEEEKELQPITKSAADLLKEETVTLQALYTSIANPPRRDGIVVLEHISGDRGKFEEKVSGRYFLIDKFKGSSLPVAQQNMTMESILEKNIEKERKSRAKKMKLKAVNSKWKKRIWREKVAEEITHYKYDDFVVMNQLWQAYIKTLLAEEYSLSYLK